MSRLIDRRALAVLLGILLAGAGYGAPGARAAESRLQPATIGATIKPIHSLLAALMRGVGSPALLFADARSILNGRADPDYGHSQMQLVFRLGAPQEDRALSQLPGGRKVVMINLMKAPGVRLMDIRPGHRNVGAPRVRPKRNGRRGSAQRRRIERNGIVFRTRDGRKVVRPGARRNGRAQGSRNGRRARAQETHVAKPDPFIWLDPRNAIAMARHMARELIRRDPGNARKYKRNLAALIVSLEALDSYVTGLLRPVRTNKFAVLNNRLQYFEEQYLLRPAVELKLKLTTLTVDKARQVGKQLQGGSMRCILAPTWGTPEAFQAMQPGGPRRVIAIDPYGDGFDAGPEMYENMMRAMGEAYGRCLALAAPPKKTNGNGKSNGRKN